ncbi:MAG: riboflavin synthase [Gemmatimonadaceae bacterium]
MFTGLVDDIGTITQVIGSDAGRELLISCRYTDLVLGESIAVNGACLTVRTCGVDQAGQGWFTVAAVVTTLDRTTISSWHVGRRVNLERAVRLGDRLGGHLVLGHVDTKVPVRAVTTRDDARLIDLALPTNIAALMVAHGSITVDGVSLTVNALLDDNGVQLSLIEYTLGHTTLGDLRVGDQVHVEADVLAKHVERLLAPRLMALGDSVS